MDYTEKSPVILSICPGMCGLERGFERACERLGWQQPITAAYVEIEAFIAYNLVKQMEQGVLVPAPIHTNVKTFDGTFLRDRIDAIFGGYPCQPFSVAGLRKGVEDPRHLWPFIGEGEKSIIGTTRPIFCFFENVPGHISEGYDTVYRDLSELGYAVEPGIFSAEEVGAPHKRKRLFILAIRKDYLVNPESSWAGKLRDTFSAWQGYGFAGASGLFRGSEEELADTGLQRPPGTEQQATGLEQCSEGNLADTAGERQREQDNETSTEPRENTRESISGRSSQLADANSDGNAERYNAGGISETSSRNEIENGERERDRTEPTPSGELRELADTTALGIQGSGAGGEQVAQSHEREKLFERIDRNDKWPARPGEQQYDWEAPRTESCLGFTVNGYNFREDLLRMAGNGVVQQTATLAFEILLHKHLKNIENI